MHRIKTFKYLDLSLLVVALWTIHVTTARETSFSYSAAGISFNYFDKFGFYTGGVANITLSDVQVLLIIPFCESNSVPNALLSSLLYNSLQMQMSTFWHVTKLHGER